MALNAKNDKMDDVQVTEEEVKQLRQEIDQRADDLQSYYETQMSALKNKMEDQDQKKVLEENVVRLLRRNAILEETVKKKEEEERHVAWELVREFKKEVQDKEVQTLELEVNNVAIKELEKWAKLDEWTIGKQEKVIQEKNEKIKELRDSLNLTMEQLRNQEVTSKVVEAKLEEENGNLKQLVQQLRGEIEGFQGKRKVPEEERGDGEGGGDSEPKRLKVDEEKEEATKKKAVETVMQERLSDSEEEDKVEDELNGTNWKYDLSWRATEIFELPVITDELAIVVSCCVPVEYNNLQENDAK